MHRVLLAVLHTSGCLCGNSHYLTLPRLSSGPITSWEIDWEIVETVSDFIFLGSKITVDIDFSCEIKRHLPWKESYDNPR